MDFMQHLLKLFVFLMVHSALLLSSEQTCSLVVSYQTGPEGERLDRIRFRLVDEGHRQHLYPQGKNYACDAAYPNRIVVVDELSPGSYTLEFLVPNTDGLFQETHKRIISLRAGERVRVDHYFHPRYATIKVAALTRTGVSPFVSLPRIFLEDCCHKVRAVSTSGEMYVSNLIPGDYTLLFEEMAGYTNPPPMEVTVRPGENGGPFVGVYGCELDMPTHCEGGNACRSGSA